MPPSAQNVSRTAPPPTPATSVLGLYVHVPFCASRCLYCDFYSTTPPTADPDAYVRAVVLEARARAAEAHDLPVATVYLGGGTPTQLPTDGLRRILDALRESYDVLPGAEVTVEANPDDASPAMLRALYAAGVNRLSLGVQSFSDEALRLVRRRHTARQAADAVRRAADLLTDNISIDLIYGLPVPGRDAFALWQADLEAAFNLPVTHLSAYALTYEAGTPLARLRDAGRVREVDDETSRKLYYQLLDTAQTAGFEHYELSNFARQGFRSRHNSAYWQGVPYLGFGPAAHSYDGLATRRWNLPDLQQYVALSPDVPHDGEHLTAAERHDELVMTRLRTCEGLPLSQLPAAARTRLLRQARRYVESGLLRLTGDCLVLTRQGLFLSDGIMADLMEA